jgi:hypothetical protein
MNGVKLPKKKTLEQTNKRESRDKLTTVQRQTNKGIIAVIRENGTPALIARP